MDGKPNFLGYFDVEEDAARQFDQYAARLGRRLNFEAAVEGSPLSASGAISHNLRFNLFIYSSLFCVIAANHQFSYFFFFWNFLKVISF
jgi:hypothetical protein